MKPDPYVLTIAEVRVADRVALTTHLPARVALVAGQELHVNVRYRLKEQTLDKESYRFRLVSHIGDQTPPDREQTWYDRPLLHDELQGFIGHRYRFDSRGTFEGQAMVLAQYLSGRWGGDNQKVQDEARESGQIQVTVA